MFVQVDPPQEDGPRPGDVVTYVNSLSTELLTEDQITDLLELAPVELRFVRGWYTCLLPDCRGRVKHASAWLCTPSVHWLVLGHKRTRAPYWSRCSPRRATKN